MTTTKAGLMARKSEINIDDMIRKAAFLRREFLGRDFSRDKDRRHKTLYFFDTDIVKTYCAPWMTGPTGEEGNQGYGVIFPFLPRSKRRKKKPYEENREAEERATYTALLLAAHVFENVRPSMLPAYQFNAQFKETKKIYELVRNQSAQYFSSSRIPISLLEEERLKRALAFISSRVRKRTAISLIIDFVVDDIIRMLDKMLGIPKEKVERSKREWERFVKLNMVTGGIYSQKMVEKHISRIFPENHRLKEAVSILSEENMGFSRFEDLKNSFHEAMGSRYKERLLDAEAVATLYLLNKKLVEEDTGWRAILVTGAPAVIDACYKLANRQSYLFRKLKGIFGNDFDENFTIEFPLKYVRHLWAYTTEALLEPELRENPQQFINWLDGFLAFWAGKTEFTVETLSELWENNKGRNIGKFNFSINSIENLIKDWDGFTNKTISNARLEMLALPSEEALKLRQKIVEIVRKNTKQSGSPITNWHDLIQELREEVAQTRDYVFTEFSNIGGIALYAAAGFDLRNPPDLYFRTLPNAGRILKNLCSNEKYDARKFKSDFESLREDCYSGDDDRRQLTHLRFLVLGAAFAAANKWGVALSQAKRAISIIERARGTRFWPIKVKDPAKTFMSGREAYYLAAVATRIIADEDSDFDAALELLDKAENALLEDQRHGTAQGMTPVRFKSERLANALARYYFCRHKNESIDSTEKIYENEYNEYRYCDKLAYEVYDHAYQLIKLIEYVSCDDKLFSEGCSMDDIYVITQVHIFTNIIQASIIRCFRIYKDRDMCDDFLLSFGDLKASISGLEKILDIDEESRINNANKVVRLTPLIRLYYDAGRRVVDLMESGTPIDKKRKEKAHEEINYLYDSLKDNIMVSVYDKWRFYSLKDFIKKLYENEKLIEKLRKCWNIDSGGR